jgi:hypothetical protein
MGLRRWRAVTGLNKTDFPHLITRSEVIYNGLHDNVPLFENTNPPLPVLLAKIQELIEAQRKAGTRAVGAKQARDAAAASVITLLETARAYIQGLADALPPEQAANLIKAGGMLLGNAPSHTKPLLQATQGQPSGPVHIEGHVGVLTADAKGKVFFNWAFSADGGQTWIAAPPTPHGRTDIPDLTPLTTYAFRVSVNDKNGPGEWSQAVTLFVR